MKVLSLQLHAFGAFEDKVLDFAAKPDALTIVYGPNEAGKSTSLRALEGLLFGIEGTQDAHRHAPKNLRVGGSIQAADGEVMHLVRRRGLKGTLRDDQDRVIDDAPLRKLLRGIDREVFKTLYGLDPVRLREGAKALLSDKGTVSQSLFEAGLAGAGVSRLVTSLRDQAEAIFAPRATTRPLNQALRDHAAASKKARTFAMSASTYQKQLDGIAAHDARRAELEEELRAIDQRRRKLERGRRVAPLLAARRGMLTRRAELEGTVLLPVNAGVERERALLERDEAERGLSSITSRRDDLRLELATLRALRVEVDTTEAIQTLSQLAGATRNEARRRELLEERDNAASRLEELREGSRLVLDATEEQAVLAAISARDAALEPLSRARDDVAQLEAALELARGGATSESLEQTTRTERVRLALDAAERAASRAADRKEAERRARAAQESAKHAHKAVGSTLAVDELAAAPLPSVEALEGWASAFAAARAEEDRQAARLREAAASRAPFVDEREALLAKGDVSTPEHLDRARRSRDEALVELAKRPGEGILAQVVDRVRRADEIGDRMLLDASRAARLRTLSRSIEDLDALLIAAESAREEARERAAAALRESAAAMAGCGAPAVEDPRLLLSFHHRLRTFLEGQATFGRERASADALGADEEAARSALSSLFEGNEEATLVDLVAVARAHLARATTRAAEGERAAAKLEELEGRLANAKVRARSASDISERAQDAATTALSKLGLPPLSTREDVVAAARRGRDAREATSRIVKIDAQLGRVADGERKLTSYLATLTAALGRAESEGDPIARAELLLVELRRAEGAGKRASECELKLRELDERAAEITARRDAAEATLATCLARAAVTTLDALREAENRSERLRSVEAELAGAVGQLYAAGETTSIDDLDEEYSAFDIDQADVELDRIEIERDQLEREKDRITHDRAGMQLSLGSLEESQAAEHAEQAQLHFAKARGLALHYAKLRLAAVVLEREIETYRKLHQAPVLALAEKHFARLTRGSFDELRVIVSDRDEPELVCVRKNVEVPIDGLSDGAKDQLFLALRLATIERHSEGVEPLPLILDDVLIHFDEDRARAALEVLSTLASRMQVLMFTHQEKIVELAQDALPGAVQVVRL